VVSGLRSSEKAAATPDRFAAVVPDEKWNGGADELEGRPPSASGNVDSPAFSTDSPRPPYRNGATRYRLPRKAIAPVNMTAVVLANSRSASSRRRIIGSGVRVSARAKAASSTILASPVQTISGELQPR